MEFRRGRMIAMAVAVTATAVAAAIAVVTSDGVAVAAATPVSNPRIVTHFNFGQGQTPEDMVLEPNGAVDISLAQADQAVRVTPNGDIEVLGQLPKSGNCPVIGMPVGAGIARAPDGAVYMVDCTGNTDTGVWRIRSGTAPVQVAQLPADSFPNDMALDDQTGDLYVADSVLGVVWKVSTYGGAPVVWATGPALQRTSFFGANGIAVYHHTVWVGNSDQGTIVRIPIRSDGTPGSIRPAVTMLAGGVDNFTVFGSADTILATLNGSSQVVLIQPDGHLQVVLTAADGLSNPTDVVVRHNTIYVTSAAYFTYSNANLLIAHLNR